MIYRNGYSLLGFGCMRLPGKYQESEQLILEGIKAGINYYDTAYMYPGNEVLLGKILSSNNCREKVKIATKLPTYLIKSAADIDKIFDAELERLQTDYIDNYLMHMLPDVETWERLKSLGIEPWMEDKKQKGQIKNIGFSFHGNSGTFIELLNVYPWDFAQIQYNYMDEHSQAGKAGLLAAYEKNIPIVIMEPLRGGNLTNGLCSDAKAIISKAGKSPAEIGLSWLYNQKEVTCVLSGMTNLADLQENLKLTSKEVLLTDKDLNLINDVKKAIDTSMKIGCTGCSYCMPCPAGVDIPGSFRCFNVSHTEGYKKGFMEYMMMTTFRAARSNVSLCVKCGKCEEHCPQHLLIRENLNLVRKRFEHPIYKVTAWGSKRFFNRKNK